MMKKFMIFLVSLVPIMLILVVQLTSTYIEKTKYVAVETIKIEHTDLEIFKVTTENAEYKLTVNVYPVSATNKDLIYVSSDENIAVVDENGNITFKDFGYVTITVKSETSDYISASREFFVTDTKPHRIELVEYPGEMRVGETFFIKSNIVPNEAEDKTLSYSSSNADVATVSPDGKITAVSAGKTTISLIAINGVTQEFDLDITMPASGIYIPAEQKNRITGKSTIAVPTVEILPENATNKKAIFSCDDPEIAYIENNSKIVFLKSGTATFTAATEDGGFTEKFSVNYTGGYVIGAEISTDSKNVRMDYVENKRFTLNYSVYPLDADLNNVWFESSDTSVVVAEGKEFIVKGGGKAVITMFADTGDNKIVSKANVYISRAAERIEAADVVVYNPVFSLDYKVFPTDFTDDISFSVNSNRATVTKDGIVKFNEYGEVIITVSTTSGVQKQIRATYEKADAINKEINKNEQKITVNYKETFMLLFNAELGFGVPTYSVDNTEILSFNEETKEFTANLGGETKITATDGISTFTVSVLVIRKAEEIRVSSTDADLEKEETITAKTQIKIDVQVLPVDTTDKTVSFEVDDDDIAQISQTGLLTFYKAGTITVTAKTGEISWKKQIESTYNLPNDFSLDNSNIVLEDVNRTFDITVKEGSVFPFDCNIGLLDKEYTSSNKNVATVSDGGKITAVGKGNAVIYVKIGNVQKSIQVEVKVKTKEISILYKNEKITKGYIIGDSVQLGEYLLPIEANDKRVVWSLEQTDIATISDSGKLTFNSGCYGKAVVVLRAADSGISTSIEIERVKNPSSVDIYFNDVLYSGGTLTVAPKDTADISLKIVVGGKSLLDPENAIENIKYSATCDSGLTLTITSQGGGYYKISKNVSINKKLSATVNFSVGEVLQSISIEYLNLQSVDLELKNSEDINFGLEQKRVFGTLDYATDDSSDYTTNNRFSIAYSRKPQNNQDTLYWFSSNENFAYVNENGYLVVAWEKITAETQVTITVGDAPVLDKCSITASYTYTFVPGINVYTNNDYVRAVARNNNIILQTAFDAESGSDKVLEGADSHYFSADLYGNGYTLNFNNYTCQDVNFYGNVRNVTIKRANNSKDKDFGDKVISVFSSKEEKLVEYCVFQNAKKVWTAITANAEYKVIIKNCIIEHCSQTGLQIGSQNVGGIYLENTIFSDVAQAAVDFQGGNLYIKGFFDVYNFTTASEFENLDRYIIKVAFGTKSLEKYITKNSEGEKCANVAVFVSADAETVYFWDKFQSGYVANIDSTENVNGVCNGTGLGYEKVTLKLTSYYLFCSPIEGNSINGPDVVLTESGRAKVYRTYGK